MLLVVTLCFAQGCTQQQSPKTFSSPERASDALVKSLRSWSPEKFKQLLGPDAQDVLFSGDDVADRVAVETFLAAYDQSHHFTTEANGDVTLSIGDQDWPMPIPLVQDERDRWYFDIEAGKDEVINRRIGRNELDVIETCQAVVDAQREYIKGNVAGDGVKEYAQKFLSDAGKKNGLYWPTAAGEKQSPLGPLVAEAVDEGYTATASTEPRPYHGYCYRMLTKQGPNAPGGAKDYLVNGRMTGGFAVIAYPADYGNSGIMSFITSAEGLVYQKDLGAASATAARTMEAFDPDADWQPIAANLDESDSVVSR
jgi:hypothetical protein